MTTAVTGLRGVDVTATPMKIPVTAVSLSASDSLVSASCPAARLGVVTVAVTALGPVAISRVT